MWTRIVLALGLLLSGVAPAFADGFVETSGSYAEGAQLRGFRFDVNGALKVSQATLTSGEDQTNDVLKVEQRFGYTNITLAAPTTTAVKAAPGFLHAITFNKPVATGTLTCYDNTAASGTVILTITTPASPMPVSLTYDVSFGTGLTCVTATAAQDITISSR